MAVGVRVPSSVPNQEGPQIAGLLVAEAWIDPSVGSVVYFGPALKQGCASWKLVELVVHWFLMCLALPHRNVEPLFRGFLLNE